MLNQELPSELLACLELVTAAGKVRMHGTHSAVWFRELYLVAQVSLLGVAGCRERVDVLLLVLRDASWKVVLQHFKYVGCTMDFVTELEVNEGLEVDLAEVDVDTESLVAEYLFIVAE